MIGKDIKALRTFVLVRCPETQGWCGNVTLGTLEDLRARAPIWIAKGISAPVASDIAVARDGHHIFVAAKNTRCVHWNKDSKIKRNDDTQDMCAM